MVDLYETVLAEFEQGNEDISDYIYEIDRNNGVSITIADEKRSIEFSSIAKKTSNDFNRLPKEIEDILSSNPPLKRDGLIYTVAEKEGQIPRVVLIAKTKQNHYIVLTKTMKGIRESVSIANRFYIFTGLLMMFLGGIATLLFSRIITSSLVEMSKVSRNIANLDFKKRVKIRTQDEIGELGESINTIADQLSVNIENLEQDIERRKRLVRDMTHEMKTPIGVVKGYAEGLLYGVASSEEKRDAYCKVIVQECDRMDAMVKELLDLSKLEASQGTLLKTKFFAMHLMRSIEERFEKALQDKQLAILITCDDEVSFYADYSLLERAADNYVTNAIKYANEGSSLRLMVKAVDAGTLFEVFNEGPALSEADLKKIWDVFYMGDASHSRSLGNHGLGLAIVQTIITAHGGRVEAKNCGNGVCFSFIIPVA
jgi:signal transduction histidine kinase